MFKIPRDKAQIVHLARQVNQASISNFHKMYQQNCKDPHNYLFLDLTQQIKDILRYRTNIFPRETSVVLHLYRVINRLKSQIHFLHVLKDVQPKACRALLAFADDELINAIVECAINKLNETINHRRQ